MKRAPRPQRPKERYTKILYKNKESTKPDTVRFKPKQCRRPKHMPDYSAYSDDDFD